MENKPFKTRIITTNVRYMIRNPDYIISDVVINKDKIYNYKNTEQYLNKIINYIKDNIIKHCKDLKSVKIYMNVYEQGNIIHRFIIAISKIIADLLKLKEDTHNKSIIIYIIYDNKLIFLGDYDFSYLF